MLFARRIAGCKDKARPVKFVLDARSHDAHYAFVKIRVKNANGWRRFIAVIKQRLGNFHGLLAHVAFNVATLTVDGIQLPCQFLGSGRIVGDQAFNAQGHV